MTTHPPPVPCPLCGSLSPWIFTIRIQQACISIIYCGNTRSIAWKVCTSSKVAHLAKGNTTCEDISEQKSLRHASAKTFLPPSANTFLPRALRVYLYGHRCENLFLTQSIKDRSLRAASRNIRPSRPQQNRGTTIHRFCAQLNVTRALYSQLPVLTYDR
jgi:hypothetical protein